MNSSYGQLHNVEDFICQSQSWNLDECNCLIFCIIWKKKDKLYVQLIKRLHNIWKNIEFMHDSQKKFIKGIKSKQISCETRRQRSGYFSRGHNHYYIVMIKKFQILLIFQENSKHHIALRSKVPVWIMNMRWWWK